MPYGPVTEVIKDFQTLIVGMVGLSIAFRQWRISKRQLEMIEEQKQIVEEQKKQSNAIARLALDRVIPVLLNIHSRSPLHGKPKSEGSPYRFDWDPAALGIFAATDMDWNDAELEAAALVASPDNAANITGLIRSARELKTMADDYKKSPWLRSDAAKAAALDKAHDDFLVFASHCVWEHPSRRAAS